MLTLDTETYRFYPGNMTPKIVCGSWANGTSAGILLRDGILDLFEQTLNSSEEINGSHIAYDFGCVAAARPHLLPLIFKAYDENRVFDILVAEALYDIFYGQIFRDPNTHQPFERYSQGMIEERLLGIDRSAEKMGENTWRTRYNELDGVPFELWPPEARGYPVRDARFAHDSAVLQKQRPENLHSVPEQVRAAWALHLASVWGIRTDPVTVEQVAAEIEAGHTAALARFAAIGFFRPDGSKDIAKIARAVALAYGGEGTCETCNGSGKVPSAKTKKPVNCGTCGATGLNISSVPTTPTGRVLCDRDALQESGDEQLESFAEIGENEKWYSTYLPLIRLGAVVPINAETNVLVATGRCSYRKPNLQNLPRRGRIRETFVPRLGRVLYTVDYGGLELVTLAQTCLWWVGSSKMAEALNAGEDLHAKFGAAVLNVPFEEFMRRLEAKDKVAKNFRQMAKCFHPDTEILTPGGWKRIADLTMQDEVAAAIPGDDGVRLEWQRPTALTQRPCPDGHLLHLKNEGMDLRVTEDHRMLVQRANGAYAVVTPREAGKARRWLNAGVMPAGDVVIEEKLLRLAVAVQADGNYSDPGKQIKLGFSKERKILRMENLLKQFNAGDYCRAEYTNGKVAKKTTQFTLRAGLSGRVKDLLDAKQFPWWWLKLTQSCREVVLDEFRFWDGSRPANCRMAFFSSTLKQNVDVLQALASIAGRKTRAVWTPRVEPEHGCCKLTVRAPGCDGTRGENLEVVEVPYDGDVVCLSVPASFVLVRDGGVPVITGQCANFGMPGGLGADRFVGYARQSYGAKLCELAGRAEKCGVEKVQGRDGKPLCRVCRQVAKELREQWFAHWPEVTEYHEIVASFCDGPLGGRIEVCGAEPFPGPGLTRGGVGFCDGANLGFQGNAARGAKHALYNVTRESYIDRSSVLYGSRPLIFVHDEIIGEAREDRAHEVAHRVSEIMIETMRIYTPDVRVTAPPALMPRWYKGADPVYRCPVHTEKKPDDRCCPAARLVPWTPPPPKRKE